MSGRDASSARGNFRGTHASDGSGTLQHYRSLEAIKTRSGLVLASTQCWATGWAKCTRPHLGRSQRWTYKPNPEEPNGAWIQDRLVAPAEPGQAAARVPLELLRSLLGDSLWDVVRVIAQSTESGRSSHLLRLSDGTAAYVGWDTNIDDKHTQCFTFRLSEGEARRCRRPQDALELLKPRAVQRAEAQGIRVRRQGEWFLIPTTVRPRWVYRRGRPLDNHRPLEWGVPDADPVALGFKLLAPDYASANPSGLPARVLEHTTGPILDDWAPQDLSNEPSGRVRLHQATCVLVRGCLRHTGQRVGVGRRSRPQHSPLSLGKQWHVAVTHGRTCLTWDGSRGRRSRPGGAD